MQWTPQQDGALKAVAQWMKDPSQQVFRLMGYAGTGKTTLARHLAEGVSGRVMFGAFTGKAAHVLRLRGCPGASTIHSMIYYSGEASKKRLRELELELADLLTRLGPEARDPRIGILEEAVRVERLNAQRPIFSLNPDSDVRGASLVVIDECSMVDDKMGEDLLSFGAKVLVLGDPAQLPPVKGSGGFFTEGSPDVMLTDIQRQARDNPIIALATTVREGRRLEPGAWGSSEVLAAGSRLAPESVVSAGQVLVGKNATRHMYNRRMRQILGRTDALPEEGDKLVCLRNNHDLGLLNGGLWQARSTLPDGDTVMMTISSLDMPGVDLDVLAHQGHFLGQEVPWWDRKDAEEFDYGYAMTVHKSQGSQWEDVLILDESRVFRDDWARWLYTAVTRAQERVRVLLT